MFEQRAPEPDSPYPGLVQKIGNIVNQGIFPGMCGGGGGLALNQLLVVMDGIDNPPFFKRVLTNKINAFLDAIYFVPRRHRQGAGAGSSRVVVAIASARSCCSSNGLGTIAGVAAHRTRSSGALDRLAVFLRRSSSVAR